MYNNLVCNWFGQLIIIQSYVFIFVGGFIQSISFIFLYVVFVDYLYNRYILIYLFIIVLITMVCNMTVLLYELWCLFLIFISVLLRSWRHTVRFIMLICIMFQFMECLLCQHYPIIINVIIDLLNMFSFKMADIYLLIFV